MAVVPRRRRIRGAFYKHTPCMITCGQLEDFLNDYLDGTLSVRRRVAFELHLVVCEECITYLSAFKKTIGLTAGVFLDSDAAVPADVPEDLLNAVMDSLSR